MNPRFWGGTDAHPIIEGIRLHMASLGFSERPFEPDAGFFWWVKPWCEDIELLIQLQPTEGVSKRDVAFVCRLTLESRYARDIRLALDTPVLRAIRRPSAFLIANYPLYVLSVYLHWLMVNAVPPCKDFIWGEHLGTPEKVVEQFSSDLKTYGFSLLDQLDSLPAVIAFLRNLDHYPRRVPLGGFMSAERYWLIPLFLHRSGRSKEALEELDRLKNMFLNNDARFASKYEKQLLSSLDRDLALQEIDVWRRYIEGKLVAS